MARLGLGIGSKLFRSEVVVVEVQDQDAVHDPARLHLVPVTVHLTTNKPNTIANVIQVATNQAEVHSRAFIRSTFCQPIKNAVAPPATSQEGTQDVLDLARARLRCSCRPHTSLL